MKYVPQTTKIPIITVCSTYISQSMFGAYDEAASGSPVSKPQSSLITRSPQELEKPVLPSRVKSAAHEEP